MIILPLNGILPSQQGTKNLTVEGEGTRKLFLEYSSCLVRVHGARSLLAPLGHCHGRSPPALFDCGWFPHSFRAGNSSCVSTPGRGDYVIRTLGYHFTLAGGKKATEDTDVTVFQESAEASANVDRSRAVQSSKVMGHVAHQNCRLRISF